MTYSTCGLSIKYVGFRFIVFITFFIAPLCYFFQCPSFQECLTNTVSCAVGQHRCKRADVGGFCKKDGNCHDEHILKADGHRVTYKIGGRCTQVNYILCRRCNLKAIQDCKVVSGENMEIIKRKQVKVEARAKL